VTKARLELTGFKTIEPDDIEIIRSYVEKYQFETCDYNTANLFSWSHFMNVKWAMYKERLMFYNFNTRFMLYPLGAEFSPKELNEISVMIENQGFEGSFISVPEGYIESKRETDEYFNIIYDEGNSDYLYETERLVSLSGRKLNKKKNLVSQFRRSYPGSRTEIFKRGHIDLCLELAKNWCVAQNEVCDEDKQLELNVMERALNNHELIGLEGVLLFIGSKLVAFALFSSQRSDTATIHFEKFDYAYKGAAQLINRETAVYLKDRFKFINREQDVCKEGLRRAKLSYEPVRLIPTYRLIRK
jgi:hypothetical protein